MLNPENLVGSWRRFGPVGPVYQVVGIGNEAPDGDKLMVIKLLESDEVAEYRLSHVLDDPVEN